MSESPQIDTEAVRKAVQAALQDAQQADPAALSIGARPTLAGSAASDAASDFADAFKAAVATLDPKDVGLDVFRAVRPHLLDFGNTFAAELSSSRRLGALGSLITLLLAQYALYQPPPGR